MPRSSASFGEPIVRSTPSTSMRPASGASAPDAIRASVDLPEPFSPVSACTTPASSARSTSSRATTPGNRLVIPVRRSSGVNEGPRLLAGERTPRRARRCGPRTRRRRRRRARSRAARRSSCSRARRSPGRSRVEETGSCRPSQTGVGRCARSSGSHTGRSPRRRVEPRRRPVRGRARASRSGPTALRRSASISIGAPGDAWPKSRSCSAWKAAAAAGDVERQLDGNGQLVPLPDVAQVERGAQLDGLDRSRPRARSVSRPAALISSNSALSCAGSASASGVL